MMLRLLQMALKGVSISSELFGRLCRMMAAEREAFNVIEAMMATKARKPKTYVLEDEDGEEIRVTYNPRTAIWACPACGCFSCGTRCDHVISAAAARFKLLRTYESDE